MCGARRRGMGVNSGEGVMKTSWDKHVQNVESVRALLVILSVSVCIATFLGCGNSAPVDDTALLRQAAKQGDAEAQFSLGWMYANSDGVHRSRGAVIFYHMAAEQGHAAAQYNLGNMYSDGKVVPEDDAEAVKWYRKAAEQGNAEAQ